MKITSCISNGPRPYTKVSLNTDSKILLIDGIAYDPSEMPELSVFAGAHNATLFMREARRAGWKAEPLHLAHPAACADDYAREMGEVEELPDPEAQEENLAERRKYESELTLDLGEEIPCPICGGKAWALIRHHVPLRFTESQFSCCESGHCARLSSMYWWGLKPLFQGEQPRDMSEFIVERIF